MLAGVGRTARTALTQLGGIGRSSRNRAAAASRAAYTQSKSQGVGVSHLASGGRVGMPSRTGGMTAKQRLSAARSQNARSARSAANAARDAEFLRTGKRRAIVGGAVVGGGALTANPKSNQSRTASFGNGQRRPIGGGIQSPQGTGRYAG